MEEDLQGVFAKFFVEQDAEWYTAGIYKLISGYKCLYEQGDYIEK